jgi:DNA-binding CsgD family transcriptional regulator
MLPVIPNPWSLTPTECYIVARLSEGERLTDIGRSLGISVKTAWVHRDRATGKMGAASIAETIERWLAEQVGAEDCNG